MKRIFLAGVSLLVVGCASTPDGPVIAPILKKEPHYTEVSLIRLIASAETYDGKYVMIEGVAYFDSKHSINAIYLTREDKRVGNGLNGIFLFFDPALPGVDHLNDKYVLARGRFRADIKGHIGAFSSSLADVTLVRSLKPDLDE